MTAVLILSGARGLSEASRKEGFERAVNRLVGVIFILDKADGLNVLGDAERVVRGVGHIFDLAAYRIVFYRDATGIWDGLAVGPSGEFAGFVPLGAKSGEEAAAAARERPHWTPTRLF